MNLEKYVIKQGTPESKLLSQLGFDRKVLTVTKWKGRRRSNGGFGRGPVEWQIIGKDDVERFCNGIVLLIGSKNMIDLTSAEQETLMRSKKIITALKKIQNYKNKEYADSANRIPIIQEYINRHYPNGYSDFLEIMSQVDNTTLESIDDIKHIADRVLGVNTDIWIKARKTFIKTLTKLIDSTAEHPNR